MNYLYEKISYIKGLTDGLYIEESSDEGRVLVHIIDALEALTEEVADMREEQEEINEYIEVIDEDLSDLEDEIYLDFDDICPECDEELGTED